MIVKAITSHSNFVAPGLAQGPAAFACAEEAVLRIRSGVTKGVAA